MSLKILLCFHYYFRQYHVKASKDDAERHYQEPFFFEDRLMTRARLDIDTVKFHNKVDDNMDSLLTAMGLLYMMVMLIIK